MRSNTYARFVAPSKFENPLVPDIDDFDDWAYDVLQEGDALRMKLEGRRILPALGEDYAPSAYA